MNFILLFIFTFILIWSITGWWTLGKIEDPIDWSNHFWE